MDEQTVNVPIPIKTDDHADLQEWARNSNQILDDLLQEALQHYLEYVRADNADLDRRAQGASYTIEEVRQHLAERRRQVRTQAAE